MATTQQENSIFRSDVMKLCQFFLSNEAAYNCVSELGELGIVQFRDLNPDVNSFQRKFVNDVRRCDEMERKLRYIEQEMVASEIDINDDGENPEAPQPKEMVDLEATFEKLENELREVNANNTALDRNFLELTELKHVLEAAQSFMSHDSEQGTNLTQSLIPEENRGEPIQLGFVAGVIPRDKLAIFERMLWRVSRGNAFLRQQDIASDLKDPVTGNTIRKSVYMVFFQGEHLKIKVKKICEGCKSTLYPCPDNANEREEMLKGVKTRLADLTVVLNETNQHRQRVLAAAAKHIRVWLIKVRKIKGIYHTLNLFNVDASNKCIIAEGWVPFNDMNTIKDALVKATEKSGSTVQPIMNIMDTHMAPPTYHRTNKFTRGFQLLIEAYGVPSYREVNPGLYTCATFPFIFGVMFGDMGHGTLMLCFALWMVLSEKKIKNAMAKNEITFIFYGGRYIVLGMGLCSIFTGFIYNDIFSKSFNIFGSAWHVGTNATIALNHPYHDEDVPLYALNPGDREDYRGTPYWIGMDPIWQLAINKINFLNGYKMKLSIIFGVTHMMFGLCLSLVNSLFFRRIINIFCEFIPQVFFLLALFGYLCFLCLYKWVHYGDGPEFDDAHSSYCAPNVLITFINMMLLNDGEEVKDSICVSVFMFNGQAVLQKVLVLSALLCIPILLLPKPFILKRQHEKKMLEAPPTAVVVQSNGATDATSSSSSDEAPPPPAAPAGGGGHGHGAEFEFSEVFIHQAIHTIEYALGCVSHTASYLRLWALSLAHAQLSEVLWMMVFKIGLARESTTGSIMLYLIFAAWGSLTVAILVIMEGLSAFLHTLRLHWVEFCSKFYEAQGYLFTPFAFKSFAFKRDEA